MGNVTAHRFRYHPTTRFFGESPGASFGLNDYVTNYPDWYLRYSIEDMFHLNQPGQYINSNEFLLDVPVWQNPDDAANDIDAVVEAALDWMNNLVYGHDLTFERKYYSPTIDTLNLETLVENPNSHPISSTVYVHNIDSTFVGSVRLSRKTITSKAGIWGGEYPAPSIEDNFRLSISAYDSIENQEFMIRNVDGFTTIGPFVIEDFTEVSRHDYGTFLLINYQLTLRNMGAVKTAETRKMVLMR